VLCGVADESVRRTANVLLPEEVGVPDIMPVVVLSERPAGRVPELRLHLYGVTPPEPTSPAPYELPTVPPGNDEVEITTGVGVGEELVTVNCNAFDT
jgi:hypothetical protein